MTKVLRFVLPWAFQALCIAAMAAGLLFIALSGGELREALLSDLLYAVVVSAMMWRVVVEATANVLLNALLERGQMCRVKTAQLALNYQMRNWGITGFQYVCATSWYLILRAIGS